MIVEILIMTNDKAAQAE